jgi:hypothetical protein
VELKKYSESETQGTQPVQFGVTRNLSAPVAASTTRYSKVPPPGDIETYKCPPSAGVAVGVNVTVDGTAVATVVFVRVGDAVRVPVNVGGSARGVLVAVTVAPRNEGVGVGLAIGGTAVAVMASVPVGSADCVLVTVGGTDKGVGVAEAVAPTGEGVGRSLSSDG